MQRMYTTKPSTNYPDTKIGITIPEDIKDEDAKGFALGIEYVLKKLGSNDRILETVIRTMEGDILERL